MGSLVRRLVLVLALVAAPAAADQPAPDETVDVALARIREQITEGRLAEAKQLLTATYERFALAELLFALGQVEFNLGNYREAIARYQAFLATNPPRAQVALANQAIGVARDRLDNAVVAPPLADEPPAIVHLIPAEPPRMVRDWDTVNSAIAGLGGAGVVTGAVVFGIGYARGNDHNGTLLDYDRRVARSRTWQYTGIGISGAGAILVGIALVRWRVHRVEVVPFQPGASGRAVGFAVGKRW